ncbi:uncharacterized protein [Drosophila takahashii]|uniref:uncharacterized protein n=1 Tax=Drosophila takahashii TaxID=29030 RepID=UPI001CF8AF9A|nr:uncharacterized protein LOC108062976 [Drosophila takahashii]
MFKILWILAAVTNIWATDYNAIIEDPTIYTPCENGPPGSVFIHDAFNMDNMKLDLEEDGIHVSGNATVKWNFDPTDRILSRFSVMQFNRGSWEPTVYNVNNPDFCATMFDKDQYTYKYWWKYVRNREEIQEKCIKIKDTVLEFDPFIMVLQLNNIRGVDLRGRYKAVVSYEAFDKNNVRRPTSLCFEIKSELEKIKT